MIYKTGLRPFQHNLHSTRKFAIMARFLDALGKPPDLGTPWGAITEGITGDSTWGGMLANGPDPNNPPQESGGVGDCVICDDLRDIMLWMACGKETAYKPTTAMALQLYSLITGFNPADPNSDQGADPTANAHYMASVGYQGHRYDGWAPIDPMNEWHVKWWIQFGGLVKWCLNLPDFAETQFNAGQPWDYTGQSYQIVGGHDVIGVQYERIADPANTSGPRIEAYDIVTWGKRIQMTQRFKNEFASLVIAPMSLDFIGSTGKAPSGVGVGQLHKDLAAVTN